VLEEDHTSSARLDAHAKRRLRGSSRTARRGTTCHSRADRGGAQV
jgi:hypothetical protein